MFIYEKKLQYPVKITNPNPKLASIILSQYGGPYPNSLQSALSHLNPPPYSTIPLPSLQQKSTAPRFPAGPLLLPDQPSGCRLCQISCPQVVLYGLFFHFDDRQSICHR